MKKILLSVLALILTIIVPAIDLHAAVMKDYCVNPPFIVGGVTPNLLMLIDNSSSMYDLSYIDSGNVSGATILRKPYYCYDETYDSTETYTGYFEVGEYYEYDLANEYFYLQAAPPFAFPGFCDKIIANQLCINGTPGTVTRFVAKGNYLNWLTASKFDVEKEILTGGKYIEGECSNPAGQKCYGDPDCPAGETCQGRLKAESRGCVGRSFIKEALTADFVNFTDNPPGTGTDPNTSLGITFGVHGPVDLSNPTAVSKGGQTTIDIFVGDYNQQKCQAAVEAFETGANKQTLTTAIGDCIGYSSTTRNTCQYNSAVICSTDADCGYSFTPGTCGVAATGICGPLGGGVCSPSTLGTCDTNNGTCPATTGLHGECVGGSKAGTACDNDTPCKGNGTCTRYCVGGGKAGAVCGTNAGSSNALCAYSICSGGNVGLSPCAVNSDCDLKTCSNLGPKNGTACTTNVECNSGTCTAGKPATTGCLLNSDCNLAGGFCTAGKPATEACNINSECDVLVTGFGHCLPPADVQIKSTYAQSMHSCYQVTIGTPNVPGSDEINQVSNPSGCNQIYSTYMTCLGGSNDGKVCTSLGANPVECPGAGATCINGPNAIRAGSPVLLCSTTYAGYCASGNADWSSTTWNAREYSSSDECIKEKYKAYCNAAEVPPVVDPTDAPSDTSQFANLPAILSDVGIGGQLGERIRQLTVRIKTITEPRHILQDYSGLIRMGAMTFNYNGTKSECNKYCSNDPTKSCTFATQDVDCATPAPGGTCSRPVPCPMVCSATTGTSCKTSLDCPASEVCNVQDTRNLDGGYIVSYIEDTAGDHYSGLIKEIDWIEAKSWTPYAEAFVDAIGYFARYQTCSNNAAQLCSKDADCASPGTCVALKYCSNDVTHVCLSDNDCTALLGTDGKCDRYPSRGFRFNGRCEDNAATACNYASDCPSGKKCIDYDLRRNPSQFKCQANNILLITDGMSTADRNPTMNALVSLYNDGDGFTTTSAAAASACPNYGGSKNLDDLAWLAKNRNIKTFNTAGGSTAVPANLSEFITTFVVFTGEEDTTQADECNPKTLMSQTAANGGTSLYEPKNPEELERDLTDALKNISAKSASGTAASVLASGEGSGANLVQAVFFPSRQFGTTKIDWTGIMQNLWYYVDPMLGNSSIREDSDDDKTLKVLSDCITAYKFDTVLNETQAILKQDTDGDGIANGNCTAPPRTITPAINASGDTYTTMDGVKYLWETGKLLFSRAASDRTIYTNLNATNATTALTSFVDTNAAAIRPFLNLTTAGGNPVGNYNNDTNAAAVINYVRGVDGGIIEGLVPNTRNRTVTIGTETKPWKLGDIVNSTPKIQSWIPLNLYDKAYGDLTYKEFIDSAIYKGRGMVYSGGNDGMLHAFKMGLLTLYNEANRKAVLSRTCSVTKTKTCLVDADCPGAETCPNDLGKEVWGFVPKHALPYLKYMADESYCHIYYIDATPFLFDASMAIDNTVTQPAACTASEYWKCNKTKNSWKTVLIGSMRLGGSCRDIASTCADCAKTPSSNLGFSSYFALDVTDPSTPSLMWEYTNPNLGMSTSGPSIMRINTKQCSVTTATYCNTDADCPLGQTCNGNKSTNGRWFAVLGNGPEGYVNTATHQFTGITSHYDNAGSWHTNSPALYVLDLSTGSLEATLKPAPANTYHSGFVSSIVNTAIDVDIDYSDDGMYFGYARSRRDNDPSRFDTVGVSNYHPDGAMTGDNQLNFKETVAWPNSNVIDAYKGKFIEIVDAGPPNRYMTRLITSYNIAKRCSFTTATSCLADTDCPAGETCVPWKKVMTLDTPIPTASLSDSWYVFDGWTDGGVMRVLTNGSLYPSNWAVSPVITGIGPVTASVTKLQNFKDNTLRLYFGTGRYFYKINGMLDDAAGARRLYGVQDPCFSAGKFTAGCTTLAVAPKNTDATLAINRPTAADNWYIPLDGAVTGYTSERMLTDPLASTIGAVFFTTNKPSDDVCSYGGVTHLWAVRYDTGGDVPAGILKGKAIIQLSTGAIQEISLASAFTERTDAATGRGRRSAMLQGVPPAGQGLSIIVPPAPLDTILHIRKK